MAEKIVIASGKGGVGKTTLCVSIGKALSAMGKRVLLVDCDCLKSIDVLLGITEHMVYDWSDVIFGRCDSEQALYSAQGVSVLTSPENYEGITEYTVKWLIAKYEKDFDFIFFDAPAGIGTGLHLAAAVADRGLVVSTPDLVCTRSACAAGRALNRMGIDDVRLIINRVQKRDVVKGRLLNMDSVIDSTQVQLIGIVPEDRRLRLGSMGASVYVRGQASFKAVTGIAMRLCGQRAALNI